MHFPRATAKCCNLFLALLFIQPQGSYGLKDLVINVPEAVVEGNRAVLQCSYDLEGDHLYAVNWYRNNNPFYRFTPSTEPPIKDYKIRGLHVNLEESNSTQVVLENINFHGNGSYSCEVTVDKPSFQTEMQTAIMQVVIFPLRTPHVSGLKSRYLLNETIRALCSSEGSNPAANLTWYINDKPVDGPYVHRSRPKPSIVKDYYESHSSLHLYVSEKIFQRGRLNIKCSATLFNIYSKSSEKTIEFVKKRRHKQFSESKSTTTTTEMTIEQWDLIQAANHENSNSNIFSLFHELLSGTPKIGLEIPFYFHLLLLIMYR